VVGESFEDTALSGPRFIKAPGFAGGYLLFIVSAFVENTFYSERLIGILHPQVCFIINECFSK
jgi:hypothetical protein